MCAFTLVYNNIKGRLADDGIKEAKTKEIAIKLQLQIVRKWGIKSFFFLYKVGVKLFCIL